MGIKCIQNLIDKLRGKNKKAAVYDNTSYPIRLTTNERNFLLSHIKNANNYLEFGSGGSTFISILETKIPKIISVESDNNWLDYLRKWDVIPQNENSKRLIFQYINIGKTGEWGIPTEEDKQFLFPDYSAKIFESDKNFDVVFIDGRFRIACALQTILNCNKDTKILMHDFNNRPEYHDILKFLTIVDTSDTMALFKIKENFNKDELLQMYEEYKFIYD